MLRASRLHRSATLVPDVTSTFSRYSSCIADEADVEGKREVGFSVVYLMY